MSINLLDLVKDQVTGTLAKEASSFLGESESGIAQALGGIMPALLGSTIEKASTSNGAASVMDMLGKLDLGNLGNIAGIFGGGASNVNGLLNSGGGIVDMLLGNKTSGIVDFIVNMTGLKNSSVGSLLKMAAPLLMGVIGKQVSGKGLGFLTDLLMGQKSNVASAMPAGLGNLLGLGFSAGSTAKASTTSTPSSSSSTGGGNGMMKWLLPLLLLAGAFFAYKSCDGKKAAAEMAAKAQAVQDSIANVAKLADEAAAKLKADAEAAMTAMKDKFSKVDAAAKAALDKLTLDAESAPGKMKSYIDGGFNGNPLFRFKNLNFASGSAKLDATAGAEVDNIGAILKAYPAVNIEINGHTDSDGDAAKNKELSQARAEAVVARLIAKDGIDKSRLKANGFGSEQPVADNGTPEGKAQNRRIEVKVVN